MMTIHSVFLKYFDEVHRCGSIRLAARKLHVASSAVNRQILKVEDQLGVKLFERSSSGIRLTAAGELLAQHISRTLSDAERTLVDIAVLQQRQQQRLTIAGQESVIARFLPPTLMALHAEYPDIATSFQAANGDQLGDLLLQGSIDIALAFDPEPNPAVEQIAAIELPVGAIMTTAHPLAQRSQVSLSDCIPFPLVLPDHSWPLRQRLDPLIAAAGVSPNIITSSNSIEFIKKMVNQQLGIGLQTVIGIEAQVERGQFVLVPLIEQKLLTQTFALCVHRNRMQATVIQQALILLQQRLADYD